MKTLIAAAILTVVATSGNAEVDKGPLVHTGEALVSMYDLKISQGKSSERALNEIKAWRLGQAFDWEKENQTNRRQKKRDNYFDLADKVYSPEDAKLFKDMYNNGDRKMAVDELLDDAKMEANKPAMPTN